MTTASNLPLPSRPLGRRARVVVVGSLAALALLPALFTAGIGWVYEREAAKASAEGLAWQFEAANAEPMAAWPHRLAGPPFDAVRERRELRAAPAGVVASVGAEQAVPVIEMALRVQSVGQALELRVQRSLRPLLQIVAAVALASTLLSLACWTLFARRALNDGLLAEQQHNAVQRRDALTGLLNREAFHQLLDAALKLKRPHREVGILLIDIDQFHQVNDALGEPAGNELLRSTAQRIRSLVRGGDAMARHGGDQFTILVEGSAVASVLDAMARNLLRSFESGHRLSNGSVIANLSIGQAVCNHAGDSADAALQRADIALRRAKSAGGARTCTFDAEMEVDRQRQFTLEMNLRRAVQEQGFQLAFQPIMDPGGSRVIGVETLLRWSDPAFGPVSPAEFIPVLERTGLIVPVGQWVLRESCQRARTWLAGGQGSLLLSVNVSPRQFVEPDFVATVDAILHETGYPACRLELEVTEGLLMDPTRSLRDKVSQLAGRGVRLALDDFGMGFSSLATLKTFALHTLKIDRMFVSDMLDSDRESAIVRAIVELGHGLGMRVTAEGVETRAQQRALAMLGCDALQGFLFARPMDAVQFQALLDRQPSDPAADAPPSGWSQTMSALLTTL